MAITTKQTLSNKKFRQSTLDELNLDGKVIIGGELSLNDGNHGVGKIITSDENGKFVWTQTGIANGVATLDGDSKLVQNIDASKITSGKIDINRIPNGALERLIPVNTQAARFLLTTNDVQNGDTVKQLDTGVMYRVVDETNLNNSLGYEEYTAGRATAVDWTGVENKPNDLTDLSTHQITEMANINPNTVIGNDLATANSPKEIAIGQNEFLGRLLGENIKGVEAINMYGLSSETKTLLENNSNWDENGVYTGTTITDAKSGQKHYDLNYLYEFVTDSTPIRLVRKVLSATKLATARNIQATGDATWQVSFDGSQNVTAALTLANTGVVPNTYGDNITIPSITIDSKGRITSVSTNTVRSATQSVSGVMSADDKTKLDGIATGANNYTHPNHTGDVTSTGDGATVIADDAVTNSKLANMSANTIKGRLTSSGDPQDLTVAQVKTLLSLKSISEKDYWYGAQATYDVIPTKDANTIYFIPEP